MPAHPLVRRRRCASFAHRYSPSLVIRLCLRALLVTKRRWSRESAAHSEIADTGDSSDGLCPAAFDSPFIDVLLMGGSSHRLEVERLVANGDCKRKSGPLA